MRIRTPPKISSAVPTRHFNNRVYRIYSQDHAVNLMSSCVLHWAHIRK
jgi:hypothetical protein